MRWLSQTKPIPRSPDSDKKHDIVSSQRSCLDKVPRLSISIVIWILSSDTETSAATPLGGGARKVLAK